MTNTHRHELAFVGMMPASEMERARIFGSTAYREAVDNLIAVFEQAGMPHTVDSRVIKPSANKGPRGPRKKAPAAETAAIEDAGTMPEHVSHHPHHREAAE